MWETLQKKLKISQIQGNLLPRPKERTLAAFEERTGLKLPHSYREFVRKFGVGELLHYYRIASPLDVMSGYDLEQFNKDMHGLPEEERWILYGPNDLIAKMFFFASTIGGEAFAWNTSENGARKGVEYSVYYFMSTGELRKIADSFSGFIESFCLKQEPDSHGNKLPMEFLRY